MRDKDRHKWRLRLNEPTCQSMLQNVDKCREIPKYHSIKFTHRQKPDKTIHENSPILNFCHFLAFWYFIHSMQIDFPISGISVLPNSCQFLPHSIVTAFFLCFLSFFSTKVIAMIVVLFSFGSQIAFCPRFTRNVMLLFWISPSENKHHSKISTRKIWKKRK